MRNNEFLIGEGTYILSKPKADQYFENKLGINHGVENAGKHLAVDDDGNAVLCERQPAGIHIDDSLSMHGDAADAKAFGDLLNQKADYHELEKQKKRIDVLCRVSKGQLWDTETVASESYSQPVPDGAFAAEVKGIGGRTVVWNQQINPDDYNEKTAVGIRFKKGIGTTVTISGTASSITFLDLQSGVRFISGHVYYIGGISGASSSVPHLRIRADGAVIKYIYNPSVFTADEYSGSAYLRLQIPSGYDAGEGRQYVLLCVDLTQMFGAGSEPSDTADSRIAAIEAYYTMHPGYNAGELLHAAVTKIAAYDAAGSQTGVIMIPAVILGLEGYGQSEIGGMSNTLDLAGRAYTEVGHYENGVWNALDNPKVTDVSGMLTGNYLDIADGGTLVFEQQEDTMMCVPGEVNYLVQLHVMSL